MASQIKQSGCFRLIDRGVDARWFYGLISNGATIQMEKAIAAAAQYEGCLGGFQPLRT
jgi:hypothetical protein